MNNDTQEKTLGEMVEEKKQALVADTIGAAAEILNTLGFGTDDSADFWHRIATAANKAADVVAAIKIEPAADSLGASDGSKDVAHG